MGLLSRLGGAICGGAKYVKRHATAALVALGVVAAVAAPSVSRADGTSIGTFTPGSALTSTAVPAFSDVATSIVLTLSPVIMLIIGVGVLVGAVWLMYFAISRLFGVRAKK